MPSMVLYASGTHYGCNAHITAAVRTPLNIADQWSQGGGGDSDRQSVETEKATKWKHVLSQTLSFCVTDHLQSALSGHSPSPSPKEHKLLCLAVGVLPDATRWMTTHAADRHAGTVGPGAKPWI